jgi:hypothetical protein
MLVISRMCSLLKVVLSFVSHVAAQQRSQVTQHLSGSKHVAAIVRLEQIDRPGWQSLIGESSATSSSSGPFKFATLRQICAKHLCQQTLHFLK